MLRMSAEALAEESGISIATIKKLETKNSQITPRASTMDRGCPRVPRHRIPRHRR